MNQILQGKELTVFGDGNQTRAFSYIRDVAPIIAESVETPKAFNNIFNVGADTPYSVNVLAEKVAEAMGAKVKIRHLPPRNEVVDAYSSHEKARSIFKVGPSCLDRKRNCLNVSMGKKGRSKTKFQVQKHRNTKKPSSVVD